MNLYHNFIIILLLLIVLYLLHNTSDLNINTYKYSNVLESKIFYLYNNLLNNRSDYFSDKINSKNENLHLNNNMSLIILINIFTLVILCFLFFYKKELINSFSIILYLILILISYYLFNK